MATNAAYRKTYRKRIYNFEDRVQHTATPTPPLLHDSNVNADAEMMNNEVDDFFDKINDINGSQIEQSFLLTMMTVLVVKMKILYIHPDLRQLRLSSLIFFTCIPKYNCFQYVSTKTLKINSTYLTTELFALIINKIDHFSFKLFFHCQTN